MTKISFVKCDDYSKADNAVREVVNLIGGMSVFIKPSERILIKPNLLSPKDPSKAVTTHHEIVRAVTRLVKEVGAVPLVGDSHGGAIRDINLWKVTLMEKICVEEMSSLSILRL
ncbi:hypothetical protein AGMMS49921_05750 [Endomicrobiia bacterium]|nr:hypothetical protein AGMMS49921_05750 [Endomicrobiia bacterium]